MEIPDGRRYSEHHIWVQQEDRGLRIGITNWGCEHLGSIGYVELVAAGQPMVKDSPFGWAETGKAVTELIAPVSGTILEINEEIEQSPFIIIEDAYGKGWLALVEPSNPEEFDRLMTPAEYAELGNQKEYS